MLPNTRGIPKSLTTNDEQDPSARVGQSKGEELHKADQRNRSISRSSTLLSQSSGRVLLDHRVDYWQQAAPSSHPFLVDNSKYQARYQNITESHVFGATQWWSAPATGTSQRPTGEMPSNRHLHNMSPTHRNATPVHPLLSHGPPARSQSDAPMDSPVSSGFPSRSFITSPDKTAAALLTLNTVQSELTKSLQPYKFPDSCSSLRSLPSPAPSEEIILSRSSSPLSQRNPGVGYSGCHITCTSPALHSDPQKFLSSPPPSPVRLHFEKERRKPKAVSLGADMKSVQEDESSPIAPRRTFAKHSSASSKRLFAPPPLSSSPELDRFVVSSAAQYTSSGAQKFLSSGGENGTGAAVVKICESLATVLRDLRRYKRFLDVRNNDAQRLLDHIQFLLDHPDIDKQFRTILLIALIRLSRKADLYPQCFTLAGITREGEYPFTGGHFCEIYKGRSQGQLVCLKIVKMFTVSDRDQYCKAFCREGVLWGQMSHPNVLPFYGISKFGDGGNRIALVSPWLPNGTVNDFLKKSPDVNRRNLVTDVAAGMSYLHQNEVVHGDIKGANVLVTDSGRACLTDFGLASIAEFHGAQLPAVTSSGTARFQAPELIDPDFDHPRSKPSDVYAFSMTCYQIYTDQLPFFEIKRDYGVLLKVGRGERPEKPLGGLCQSRGLSDVIWRLIEECWGQIPSKRPDASQIAERLRSSAVDYPQVSEGWGDLAAPRLRAPARDAPRPDYSSDLEKTITILKTTGIFVL